MVAKDVSNHVRASTFHCSAENSHWSYRQLFTASSLLVDAYGNTTEAERTVERSFRAIVVFVTEVLAVSGKLSFARLGGKYQQSWSVEPQS